MDGHQEQAEELDQRLTSTPLRRRAKHMGALDIGTGPRQRSAHSQRANRLCHRDWYICSFCGRKHTSGVACPAGFAARNGPLPDPALRPPPRLALPGVDAAAIRKAGGLEAANALAQERRLGGGRLPRPAAPLAVRAGQLWRWARGGRGRWADRLYRVLWVRGGRVRLARPEALRRQLRWVAMDTLREYYLFEGEART